ncbi:MAG TPA: J domain-containing protein, partial [Polyangiales bacterium]|nr:J domain-containing protein [Polyangiales bacterium]
NCMAWHARHVRTTPGEVRARIHFRRSDLLYRHPAPLRDPHAEARKRHASAKRLDPEQLVLEVPELPIRTPAGFVVGPTILDMLERRAWRWKDLPTATQEAARNALPKDQPTPSALVAWSARSLDSLWPKPGQSQRIPRPLDLVEGAAPMLDHPFLTALASGGAPTGQPPPSDAWLPVTKVSTCLISEYVYRVACGVFGDLETATQRIADAGAAAWEADLVRALQLWELVQAAPGGVLVEDLRVDALRPICSVSQEVERGIMREVCRWLGVDPDLELKRPRGRPRSRERNADQGEVIRVVLQPDGTVQGSFVMDFEGVAAGTELHQLTLHALVSVLGALRTRELDTDAALLEAWLDAAVPDWRERVLDNDSAPSNRSAHDPYDVLGVQPDATMEEVTAAFRTAMKAVHPDTSGGASAWLSRAVLEAYKAIRAARDAAARGEA